MQSECCTVFGLLLDYRSAQLLLSSLVGAESLVFVYAYAIRVAPSYDHRGTRVHTQKCTAT